MKYINKSLKEIENPTKIDYVSVVDRTEEYDPADYLNMPSDDDSDLIIQKEEELTFAEKEEIRIEKEMKMDALKKEIESDEEVIVPVHQQFKREELKDQALEDIIVSADEDYKEIGPLEGKKIISVDQIREIIKEANELPTESEKRVFVIDEADKMNSEAQNSILKIFDTLYIILKTIFYINSSVTRLLSVL